MRFVAEGITTGVVSPTPVCIERVWNYEIVTHPPQPGISEGFGRQEPLSAISFRPSVSCAKAFLAIESGAARL